MSERLTRDEYGIIIAEAAAARADCTRRRIGAAIFDADGWLVSASYNGTPPGMVNCTDGGCPRGAFTHQDVPANQGSAVGLPECTAWHAERNAIFKALERGADLPTCTLYVTATTGPCPDCTELIRKTKVGRVVLP